MKIFLRNLASNLPGNLLRRLLSNRRRALRRALPAGLLFVFWACAVAFSGDPDPSSGFHGHEFNGVVHAIEDHYGVRHMRIPFLSFAMSFAARPAGVSGIRLAVFEDFHPSPDGRLPSRADTEKAVSQTASRCMTLTVRSAPGRGNARFLL